MKRIVLALLALACASLIGGVADAACPAFPFVANKCIEADELNNAFALNRGATPPNNGEGNSTSGAPQGSLWLDTSTTPYSLRECKTSPACSTSYSAGQWVTWGTVDATTEQVHFTSVATNAILTTLPTASYPSGVWRTCYSSTACADPLWYTPQVGTCVANGYVSDGGNCVNTTAGDGNSWLARWPAAGMDIRQFGCKGDGVFDNLTCLTAARDAVLINLPAGGNNGTTWDLLIPAQNYLVSATLNLKHASVRGETTPHISGGAGVTSFILGPQITCPATIAAVCVNSGVGQEESYHKGGSITNLGVGFSGTPVAGDVAFRFIGYHAKCTDIVAYNAYDGIKFGSTVDNPAGVTAHCIRPATGRISNIHYIQDGFPEVYIVDARGGAGDDVHGLAYVGVTGNDPNTLSINHSQFNTGAGGVDHLLWFYNVTNQVNGIYKFTDVYGEGDFTTVIDADSATNCLRCQFTNVTINALNAAFFSTNITALDDSIFTNMLLLVEQVTLPALIQYNGVIFSDITIESNGSFVINGTGGYLTVSNINVQGAINIDGGPWDRLTLSNLTSQSYPSTPSNFTDVATGNVCGSNLPHISWTPQLQFGGAHTSMTQSTPFGEWWRTPDCTSAATFGIALSAKGASTGAATISGLPFTCVNVGFGGLSPTVPMFATSLTGLTGAATATAAANTSTIGLKQGGAAGQVAIDNTNFTNTSTISATVSCRQQ